MKTKKRSKAAEEREADLVDDFLTLLLAGDHRPRVKNYYLSHNAVALWGVNKEENLYDAGPDVGGGMVLAGTRKGTVDVIECERVSAWRKMSLALWWEPMHDDLPESMYASSVAVLDTKSGRVVDERRRYMHLPPGSCAKRQGSGWFPFPIPLDFESHSRRFVSGSGDYASYREMHQVSSAGGNPLDFACSLSINFMRLCEVAHDTVWSVSLFPHGTDVGMTLYTDPEGVTGFYNLREKGESGRRSALRHWVRKHTRRSSGGKVGDVRRHLRGQTEFEWFGLRGVVNAPIEDNDV